MQARWVMREPLQNEEVARMLERVAELLEAQGANPYRVQAYRLASGAARKCARSLHEVLAEGGGPGLQEALGVGPSLASVVQEILETSRLAMLERLQGEVTPEEVFMSLPGMGVALARRAHTLLGVETLEELEAAAADGRLERVPGFGLRRAKHVREAVAGRLAASRHRLPAGAPRPSVALLLEIDSEYRSQARDGKLTRIRPRRFNPTGEAWLPIWHVDRHGWSFTALFSNTAQAHARGATGLWVVIYFERDGLEGQCTVVTEGRGRLAGQRVIRGRERECAEHYLLLGKAEPLPVQQELLSFGPTL